MAEIGQISGKYHLRFTNARGALVERCFACLRERNKAELEALSWGMTGVQRADEIAGQELEWRDA